MSTTTNQVTNVSVEAHAAVGIAIARLISADRDVAITFDRAIIARRLALKADEAAGHALQAQTASRINVVRATNAADAIDAANRAA